MIRPDDTFHLQVQSITTNLRFSYADKLKLVIVSVRSSIDIDVYAMVGVN